jgi:hypothetical protein
MNRSGVEPLAPPDESPDENSLADFHRRWGTPRPVAEMRRYQSVGGTLFGLFRSYKPFPCTMLATEGQNMATSAEGLRALRSANAADFGD